MLENLKHKTILITGATGLIGRSLINYIFKNISEREMPTIIALVRNEEKAAAIFSHIPKENIKFVIGDVTGQLEIEDGIDYIIHAASQTASKAFVNQPVETIQTALNGTVNMLELAREKQVESFVYLSSMEVYGSPDTDEKISEDHGTNLNTMAVRSSYPEGKRMCEAICTAYCSEYGVPAKIVRLTQTFGPGVGYNDGRVFAEFARCAIEKRNIILHTKGETTRCYLYTEDAAAAIFTVLLKGKNGEAYNAANEETYCTILEMAQMVAKECADGKIEVEIQIEDESKYGYAPVLKMNLDAQKLKRLGWSAKYDLKDMFTRMIEDMKA